MTISKATSIAGYTLIVLTCNLFAEASANSAFAKSAPMSPIGSSQNDKAPNYLGASMGSPSTDGFCTGLTGCDNSDKSWKVFAGVRMNDNIVVESGYVNFGTQSGTNTSGIISQQATAFTTAAVAGIPATDQIEVFGKAGMARWSVEQTNSTGAVEDSGTDVMVGAGANYNLGDNMGVRAEWERFKDVGNTATNQVNDIDLISIGFTVSSL